MPCYLSIGTMDQIESYWESEEDLNVLIVTNLDDIGDPYSCSDWGEAGSDSHNLITSDEIGNSESYDIFNLYNSGAYQSHIFIDHNMEVNYKAFGSVSISLANVKINQMLSSCGDDCITSQDNDNDGVSNSDDNCVETPNPDQENADGDEFGDLCDDCYNYLGDITGDQIIDVLDIIMLVNILLLGESEYSECQIDNADLNGNSNLNVLDIIELVNLIIGE